MKSDTLNDFYQVNNSDQPVKLTVNICYGQNAISKIVLNHQILPGPESDGGFLRSFEKILGTNKDLNGKNLQMTTLVLDNMENAKGTCLIISLTGGVTQYGQKLENISFEKGGVVKYSVAIKFC